MEKNMKKIGLIGIMTIVCGLVSLCIKSVVDDRVSLAEATQLEVSESWSGSQGFVGPMLCVPVHEEGKAGIYTCLYVMPEHTDADASIKSENLHRGIFDASVYTASVNMSGTFNLKNMVTKTVDPDNGKSLWIDWEHAQVVAAIADKNGIEEGMQITLNDSSIVLDEHFNNYGENGLNTIFDAEEYEAVCELADLKDMLNSEVKFTLKTNLKGSGELHFAPIGKDSKITMHGNSADPSFMGMSLPSTREISADGFTATWRVNNINRKADDQTFYNSGTAKSFDYVGTKLLVRGGQYTQTDRALKYAFLVILLSLLAVFIGEMSVNSEINALNYLLIGAALVLFYLMLLSLAEWMGFGLAYIASAVLILGMIALYLNAIVHDRKTVAAIALFMALVDVFIYILLSIADMALLVGTFGLFIILGIAMFFSLRIKTLSLSPRGEEGNVTAQHNHQNQQTCLQENS